MLGGAFEQEGAGVKKGGGGEGFLTGLGHIYVGACYTRGARSRQSYRWWGRGMN